MLDVTLHVHQSHLFHDVGHVADVSGDQEVGASDAPDAELCAILCVRLTRTVLQGFPTGTTLSLGGHT